VPPINVPQSPSEPSSAAETMRRKRPSPALVLLAILVLLAALIVLAFFVWWI
jgi:cytoskeletal protein RodZ